MGNGLQALSQHPLVASAPATASSQPAQYCSTAEPEPQQRDEVIDRTCIADGFICTLRIPTTKKLTTPDDTPYEQFGAGVKGGYINFYLFDRAECEVVGKGLRVECRLYVKTLQSGRRILYVDLYPAEGPTTHDRKIWFSHAEMPKNLPEGTRVFHCLGDINGAIGFVPR